MIKFKTPHATTSTAAELAAIRTMLQFLIDQRARKRIIFCDSKSAPQSLLSPLRRELHEQRVLKIAEVIHHLTEKGPQITFQWLHGHCGIIGIERADQTARSAYAEDHEMQLPLFRTDAARKLRWLAR